MYSMKRLTLWMAGVFTLLFGITACNVFGPDGTKNDTITDTPGFFYMMDRANLNLYQLDGQMRQLNVWNLSEIVDGSLIQGITFDGSHVWISASGTARSLFKLDLAGEEAEVIQSFLAPPNGSGTIRDIAFDGTHLWAANSGSVSLNMPPRLYKLNPENGSIVSEYDMPSTEIRGVSHIPTNGDQYGRGAAPGIYLGDRELNKFWNFRFDRPVFTDAFPAPVPPTGEFTIFPSGITYEILKNGAIRFWTVNSSLSTNYLFQLDRTGKVENKYELNQYSSPGPIVFANYDVTVPPAPELQTVSPNKGALGTQLDIELTGTGFREGTGLTLNFGTDITVSNLQFVSSSELTASIDISNSAALGFRSVTLTNPDGQTSELSNAFEVTATPPLFGFLYVLDFDSNWLYKIRESDGSLVNEWNTASIAPAQSPQGLAFDGTHLWLASAGADRALIQFEIDGDNLNEIRRIPAPYPNGTGTVRDIVYHNGSLWGLNSGDNKLYQIDIDSGDILDEYDTPGLETRGVTFVNDVLHVVDRDLGRVYSWNANSGEWVNVFQVPIPAGTAETNRYPIGIDFDGNNFWITNSRFSADFILQVSPSGDLLRSINSPRIGPDILTGIVFVEEEQQ